MRFRHFSLRRPGDFHTMELAIFSFRGIKMKVLLWIVGIIFLVGLLVVTGVLKLIF